MTRKTTVAAAARQREPGHDAPAAWWDAGPRAAAHAHSVFSGGLQVAPVCFAYSATASSSVGEEVVRVDRARQFVALDLVRTGSFSSAKTSEADRPFIQPSRSSSMSAAVVSTSVIGSAATSTQRTSGSSVDEGADGVAEDARVGEDQRRVEPEDDEAGQDARVRVALTCRAARRCRRPGRARPGAATTPAEDVEDGQRDGQQDAGEHTEEGDAQERRERQRELGPALVPESPGGGDVGE